MQSAECKMSVAGMYGRIFATTTGARLGQPRSRGCPISVLEDEGWNGGTSVVAHSAEQKTDNKRSSGNIANRLPRVVTNVVVGDLRGFAGSIRRFLLPFLRSL